MHEHLKRLIETVTETQLVKRLMSEDSLDGRVKICENEKASPEFQVFIEHYEDIDADTASCEGLISEYEYECNPSNVVDVAIIFIICGIDDIRMFDDDAYGLFIDDLTNVKGEKGDVAEALYSFFEVQQNMISNNSLEDILEVIF